MLIIPYSSDGNEKRLDRSLMFFNPFAIALGDPKTGSHRLNLAGGINSFGTTIGPIVVAFIIFYSTFVI